MGCDKSARSGVCSGWAAITLGNGSIMGELASGAISVRSGHTTLPFHVWSLWWYIGRSCQCRPLSLTFISEYNEEKNLSGGYYNFPASFPITLFSDYLAVQNIPGWYCGPDFFLNDDLQRFGRDQMDYIRGRNPRNMGYIVGFGDSYPTQVHCRGASIRDDHHKYQCKEGWKWRDSSEPNPNVIIGAMAAGPDSHDGFSDKRRNPNYTESSLGGNTCRLLHGRRCRPQPQD